MNQDQIQNTLNIIGDNMGLIRQADHDHDKTVSALIVAIRKDLVTLYEAGVERDVVLDQLLAWNVNTEDGKEIRSLKTINRWIEKAGWRCRAERSDKGKGDEVQSEGEGETREQAILRIKTLMALHGIKPSDLK